VTDQDSEKAEQQGQAQKPAQIPQPKVDESGAVPSYANFCRVTGTPEEMILDFCLNTSPQPTAGQKLVVQNRIVMGYFTAKRLLGALHLAVQRHEQAFGVLELDVAKRMGPNVAATPPAGQATN